MPIFRRNGWITKKRPRKTAESVCELTIREKMRLSGDPVAEWLGLCLRWEKMPKAVTIFFSSLLYLALGLHILFWAFIVWRLKTVSENHISLDINLFNAVSYSLIGLALLVALTRRRFYVPLAAAVLALASLMGVHYLDRNNLMLQYETWISRGMPEKGAPAKTDSSP